MSHVTVRTNVTHSVRLEHLDTLQMMWNSRRVEDRKREKQREREKRRRTKEKRKMPREGTKMIA